ncbi:MAG: hypothetical protein QM762_05705 [Chryseolinea sp.]
MARYTGPKVRISRRFNEPILGENKALQKKNYAPGQHGRGKKRKQSEYATQLAEKQKAKYIYGLLERQFAKVFEKASRKKGVTGEVLLATARVKTRQHCIPPGYSTDKTRCASAWFCTSTSSLMAML